MSCGVDTEANTLLPNLVGDTDFSVPDVDLEQPEFEFPAFDSTLYGDVEPITVDALTTRVVNGEGVFDALMQATNAHIKEQYEKNRITGADYSKVYIASIQQAMGAAVQFLLQKDTARFQAITAMNQAKISEVELVKARIELETSKAMLRTQQIQANLAKVQYATGKVTLANESQKYCAGKYNLEEILPLQKELLAEQIDVQRGQTKADTRTGEPIDGILKRQKDLLAEQKESYIKDAATKVARLYVDTWITQKGLDEGLIAPNQFQNANVNTVMTALQEMVELVE